MVDRVSSAGSKLSKGDLALVRIDMLYGTRQGRLVRAPQAAEANGHGVGKVNP
jgi:hypothetical protein